MKTILIALSCLVISAHATTAGYGIPAAPVVTPVEVVTIPEAPPAVTTVVTEESLLRTVLPRQTIVTPLAAGPVPLPLLRAAAPVPVPLAAAPLLQPVPQPLPLATAIPQPIATAFPQPLPLATAIPQPLPLATPIPQPLAVPAPLPLAVNNIATPVAPSTQFHAQDEFGGFSFGYANANSAKNEVRSPDGVTRGSYEYIDAHGLPQRVEYIADALGFRVASTNLPVAPTAPVAPALALPAAPQVPVVTPLVNDLPLPVAVVDTPEVVAAKADFEKAFTEAVARNAALEEENEIEEE